ncbi:MAG: DUF1963 domain-containing protein [Lachnospiraceae bacterium]|nr:DUF1963 domain-containing protein [Lachnospiraceae bacterium]
MCHANQKNTDGSCRPYKVTSVHTEALSEPASSDFGYETVWKKIRPFMIRASGYDMEGRESDTDDFYWDFGNWGCKIGGHPALRQADIRSEFDEYKSYTALLFQYDLTTRERLGLGTFDFFIRPEDLAACRFDHVLFHWHS